MNKVQILIVGNTTQDITQITGQISNHDNWTITGAVDAEDAISIFQQYDFDIVVFSSELNETEILKLSRLFKFQYPDVSFANLGNEAVEDILTAAVQKRKRIHRPVYAFKDDALKNAISNIRLS